MKSVTFTKENQFSNEEEYGLSGRKLTNEELDAWLDPSNDGDDTYTSEEVLAYVRKHLDELPKKNADKKLKH